LFLQNFRRKISSHSGNYSVVITTELQQKIDIFVVMLLLLFLVLDNIPRMQLPFKTQEGEIALTPSVVLMM
jgi:hypothetical protein